MTALQRTTDTLGGFTDRDGAAVSEPPRAVLTTVPSVRSRAGPMVATRSRSTPPKRPMSWCGPWTYDTTTALWTSGARTGGMSHGCGSAGMTPQGSTCPPRCWLAGCQGGFGVSVPQDRQCWPARVSERWDRWRRTGRPDQASAERGTSTSENDPAMNSSTIW